MFIVLFTCRLLEIAFWHSGMFESFGCFFVVFVVLAENGFLPYDLFGLRPTWDSKAINDLQDSYGQEWVKQFKLRKKRKIYNTSLKTDLRCKETVGKNLLLSLCKLRKHLKHERYNH